MRFTHLVVGLLCLAPLPRACYAAPAAGGVTFAPAEVRSGRSLRTAGLREVITALWQRYLRCDIKGYCSYLSPESLRLSRRGNGLQVGVAQIALGLPKEWQSFGRSGGAIAAHMTVHRAELWADPYAPVATALYWVDVDGSNPAVEQRRNRDQGLVFQFFSKQRGHWKLEYQTDSWSLSYDLGKGRPGVARTFDFDCVYPVQSLQRAVGFYTPLLGSPESVTAERATFNLNGARFVLDGSSLGGCASIAKSFPSGYAVFYVADLAAQRARLQLAGVAFLKRVFKIGNDPLVVGADPMGNIFALQQKKMAIATTASGAVRGFSGSSPYEQAASAWAEAWLRADAAQLVARCGSTGRYFDDTRVKNRGLEGGAALASSLPHYYWRSYDRGLSGLAARLDVTAVRVIPCASRTLVSYQMTLTGTGSHPFRDSCYVTQVFASPESVLYTLMVEKPRHEAMALELDSAGYPVTNLKLACHFYGDILKLGEGYSQRDAYGYFGDKAVFGVYLADPQRDGLPRSRKTNGYVNFWVRSAAETYRYLKAHGADFPVVHPINASSGIEVQASSRRILSTDSEGNAVFFTEYSGLPR